MISRFLIFCLLIGAATFLSAQNSSFKPEVMPVPLEPKEETEKPAEEEEKTTETDMDLTPEEVLKMLEGHWVGEVEITSLYGDVLNRFVVYEDFWWTDDKKRLDGLSVTNISESLKYAQSENYIKNGELVADVKQDKVESSYKAKIEGNKVIWFPLDKAKALDHQVTTHFEKRDGRLFIIKESFERIHKGNVDTVILVNATLYVDNGEGPPEGYNKDGTPIREETSAE